MSCVVQSGDLSKSLTLVIIRLFGLLLQISHRIDLSASIHVIVTTKYNSSNTREYRLINCEKNRKVVYNCAYFFVWEFTSNERLQLTNFLRNGHTSVFSWQMTHPESFPPSISGRRHLPRPPLPFRAWIKQNSTTHASRWGTGRIERNDDAQEVANDI